ncbi:hypothetical protein CUMW_224770 [Citrus unshiu]|uniref:Uncharacterized protein n=1 Tax=Citrus unshiu TaxID=55188 RepID=A0A2H5QFI5_CITUN|nr:hypothetical protein CUMW_224760 [Citrus unshiu]GAY63344.1 hypothetical protein CUMW_224770 [Citrus unshiu]
MGFQSLAFVDRELHKSHIISRGREKERPKTCSHPLGYDRWKIHIRSRVRGVDSLIKCAEAICFLSVFVKLRMNAWSGVFGNISASDESLKKCLHFLRPNTGLIQNSTCPRKYGTRQSHVLKQK